MKLTQDGAQFYNEDGELVFTATIPVRDFDMAAAIAAREECRKQFPQARF